MESEDDEKDVILLSWKKMEQSLHSEGYREGSSTGRQEAFQHGFDSGYLEGFQIGYRLGLHNGVLKYLTSDKNHQNEDLQNKLSSVQPCGKPSSGFCVLCTKVSVPDETDKYSEHSLEEIIRLQKRRNIEEEGKLKTNSFISVIEDNKLNNLFDMSCTEL